MQYDVCIIGGGVIGCAIARALTRFQLRAILVEKACEVGLGTSKANSGIIHGGHHSPEGTLKAQLEWPGNQAWDQLAAELDFGFERIGELMVAFNEAELETLKHYAEQGQARGVRGLELWDRERLHAEEPNLSSDIIAALYAPTTGVVNPYEVCFSFIEQARRNGLELSTDNAVTGISSDGEALWVKTTKALIQARFVINAAGLFADEIAALAGVPDFSIRPRKGEEYLLDKRLKGLVNRIIFPCPSPTSKGILVIPTFDGTLMVGPTAEELDDKTDLRTSSAGAEQVFDSVRRTVPAISEKDCIAEFAGLRAVADSEDFVIAASRLKGLINVAGIQSPGLTAAPAIAERVITILRDEGLVLVDNENYQRGIEKAVHVAKLSTTEQIALAEREPRYGNIICRCEYVTEGELVDAIHRGARTLDGLKFRTRAGMGRCQGGFCSWHAMQLLAEELALPLTAITKRGGESWLLLDPDKSTVSADGGSAHDH